MLEAAPPPASGPLGGPWFAHAETQLCAYV